MKKAIFTISILFFCVSACLGTPNVNDLGAKLCNFIKSYDGKVGVCYVDLLSGMKVSVNGKKVFPAASVIKVPVMAAVYNMAEENRIDLQEKIRFKESYKLGGSGVLQWMKAGREYTLWNLVRMMIILSDNTATKMVVDRIGTTEVNAYMASIGLANTILVDDTCLNESPNPNINFTTPEDMAYLFALIKQSNKFSVASKTDMLNFMKRQRYRWGIWRGVPRGVMVADKTGNVEGVLNDVGIVYAKKRPYVLAVFTNGFKKQSEARKVINKISEIAYQSTD